MIRNYCLCFLFLIFGKVSAQTISPDNTITDWPSSERLPLPDYTPEKPRPGFTLPPAHPIKPHGVPEKEPKLVVKEFRFSGNTVFTNQELQTIASPFLEHAIGATDLEQLRHRLSQHYITDIPHTL